MVSQVPQIAVKTEAVVKNFGETAVLRGLDLELPAGEVTVLLGTNGAGKSTLLRILAMLTQIDSGSVSIHGSDIAKNGPAIRAMTGSVLHSPMLYADMSVRENLMFFAEMYRLENVDDLIVKTTSQVGIEPRLDHRIRTLSHGFQKRVALARALMHDPQLLLLDEPESGLDSQSVSRLEKIIDTRRKLVRINVRCTAMMGSFAVIWEIGRKDLLLEIRNKDVVVAIAGFALLVLVIFTFAIDLNQSNAKLVGPGVLWAGIAFAGVTGLNRAFALEVEGNTLEALMLAPMSRDLIYLGKALGNFLFIAVAQIIVIPVFAVLFNLVVFRWEMLVISLLTTIGFSAVGTLFAAMSVRVRAREVMLPLLFLPVVIPLLMAAVESTSHIVNGRSWSDISQWLQLAVAFDVTFVVVFAFIFQHILED